MQNLHPMCLNIALMRRNSKDKRLNTSSQTLTDHVLSLSMTLALCIGSRCTVLCIQLTRMLHKWQYYIGGGTTKTNNSSIRLKFTHKRTERGVGRIIWSLSTWTDIEFLEGWGGGPFEYHGENEIIWSQRWFKQPPIWYPPPPTHTQWIHHCL